MPIDNVESRRPIQPTQPDAGQAGRAQRAGRFREREVTVRAGSEAAARRDRAQSQPTGMGKRLLDRVAATFDRGGAALQNVAGRRRALDITRPDGRPERNAPDPRTSPNPAYQATGSLSRSSSHDPLYATVGDPAGAGHEPIPRLLDSVAALVGPGSPAEVAETLQPIYEEMRACADEMRTGESDYEDMSRIYENLLAATEHLVEAGQMDHDDYVDMRSYESLLQVYENVGGPPEANQDDALYEDMSGPAGDDVRAPGAQHEAAAAAPGEPIYESVDQPVYETVGEPPAHTHEPIPRLLDSVASLVGPGSPAEVAETLQPIYEEMRACADEMRTGESDYEDMSRIYENLLAATEHLVEAGQMDHDDYVDMRSYESLLQVYENVGGPPEANQDDALYEDMSGPAGDDVRAPGAQHEAAAAAPGEPIYESVDQPVYETVGEPPAHTHEPIPRLLDSVASLVGPGSPAEVAETLQPIYEEMRACADEMRTGESDYEDMSRIYENLLAATEHLVEAGQMDHDDYVDMRSYESLLQVYENVGGPPEADQDDALYEDMSGPAGDDVRAPGAQHEAANAGEPIYETVGEPLYQTVGEAQGEPAGHTYEPIPHLLDAVASLAGPGNPAPVTEALQPIYEEMRDCADAIAAGASDYEDMSRIYLNLLGEVEHLVEAGEVDQDVYVDMRVYQNQLDGYGDAPASEGQATRSAPDSGKLE